MKVIFLDVDGVLINLAEWKSAHDHHVRERAHPACIRELNRIVRETGAYVVMSSAWRVGRTTAEIGELLSGWGADCTVIGRTGNSRSDTVRGDEIQEWLNTYAKVFYTDSVESFVILDDDEDMAHLLPYLVHMVTNDGLTPEKADEAIAMLNKTAKKIVKSEVSA